MSDDRKFSKEEVDLVLMARDIKNIRESVDKIETKLEEDYVTRAEFKVVQSIVFGMVGIVLMGALGAILKLIFI